MKINTRTSLFRAIVLSCLLFAFADMTALANINNGTRYARVTAKVRPTGSGLVYVENSTSNDYGEESTGGNGSGGSGSININLYSMPSEGYIFLGWSESDNKDKIIDNSNTPTYSKSFAKGAASGESNAATYTMYAFFRKKSFTVKYDGNGGSGSMDEQPFTYGDAQNLSKNQYTKQTTLTFDTNGGAAISPVTKSNSFSGWSYNSSSYTDGQSVSFKADDGTTITMKATWSDASFTLPTPTKKIGNNITIEFDGWYTEADGGTKAGNAGDAYNTSSNKTLYARWKEHDITINITSSSFKEGNTVFFEVKKNNGQTVSYTVPIAIKSNGKAVLKKVPDGNYTIRPNNWTWDYTVSPASSEVNVNSNKTVNFTVNSKNSTKNRDEKSKVNWGNGN